MAFASEEAVRQLIHDFGELAEAKALAQRQSIQLIVQAISEITNSDFAGQMAGQLDSLRQSTLFLAEDEDLFRKHVAAELELMIEALVDD